ncbi:MAG: molybdopterin molybdotransferase MoeA [Sedimentisphaerales bacterium]|nr:molybdopterin molybdotransferase MoeA [Sedimentisphaerales bacterium]
MIALKEALQIVLSSARALDRERVKMRESLGRVLAEDVASDMDMPPFEKSLVDGYACRRADLAGELEVMETIQAGAPPTKAIGPGRCAKIMTGAAVPNGADCVVMIEQTEKVGTRSIRLTNQQTRDNIAHKAADVKTGQVVLHVGSLIAPQHIAVLASVGCTRPLVAKRPRVGLIAGGDELAEPSARPGPSQIRNSNSFQLAAQLTAVGATVRDYGVVKDVAAEIDLVLKTAMSENDVILFSGGVSVGDYDFVPSVLRQNDVELLFDKIAVKPGKPTVFGMSEKVFCFGLPGNPVSTFVTFELLVKPFLYQLMGHRYSPRCVQMCLDESVMRKDTERQGWIPVEIAGAASVRPVEYRGSAHILALCQAHGLIAMDVDVASLEKGSHVSVRLL